MTDHSLPSSSAGPIKVVVAGSSAYTKLMAQSLYQDKGLEISHILTPAPKPQGRKKNLIPNQVHQFAKNHNLPFSLINKKIDQDIKAKLEQISRPDILLVVDFGYLVPSWLLAWPKTAPVNIHPSKLPAWRGSSPGQMVLLHGEKRSSVSLIKMNQCLDQGAIYFQSDFVVDQSWNSQDYYDFAFNLIKDYLPQVLIKIQQNILPAQAQPKHSPTAISKRLKKSDSFIAWNKLYPLLNKDQQAFMPASLNQSTSTNEPSGLLMSLIKETGKSKQAALIERASRAFYPWPKVWTLVNTKKGIKRLKLEKIKLNKENLKLELVQLEGKKISKLAEIKNHFSSNE